MASVPYLELLLLRRNNSQCTSYLNRSKGRSLSTKARWWSCPPSLSLFLLFTSWTLIIIHHPEFPHRCQHHCPIYRDMRPPSPLMYSTRTCGPWPLDNSCVYWTTQIEVILHLLFYIRLFIELCWCLHNHLIRSSTNFSSGYDFCKLFTGFDYS